ncbi:MAG: quaternary ammonium compound efflux SMR transporter SugE [Gammaproteobacteria bacterium]
MAWSLLVIAGLFEVGWAVGLKYTVGFTRPLASVLTLIAIIISMAMLGLAAKTLPIGTAYAVWTGIGAVGTVILGILLFGDSASLIRIACLALIVTGIIGLKVLAE